MKKPALVIMAAGMGSRYGGLKQMDPMDPMGHAIIDYSIYDAKRAGFGKVVFVIKKAIEKDFKETVGARVPEGMEVCYAYQKVIMSLKDVSNLGELHMLFYVQNHLSMNHLP